MTAIHAIAVRAMYVLAIVGFVGCGVALAGCESAPTVAGQARECRESCREAGLPVVIIRDTNLYRGGQKVWRCECRSEVSR
jgi:hypothetical protein